VKILRVRRGFTTNSSGANEYLPDAGRDARSDSATPRADAAPAALTTVEPWGTAAPQAEPMSNSSAVGTIFAVVLGAFVAGPIVRMVLRRRRATRAPDDAGGDGA
jgi:hypothetical protein